MNTNIYSNQSMEIAILQEDVNKYKPGIGLFTIPALAYNNVNTKINTSVTSQNKDSSSSTTKINTSSSIKLNIPLYCTRYYSKKYIPKGTKFIVAFIGGDINNAKIIAMY